MRALTLIKAHARLDAGAVMSLTNRVRHAVEKGPGEIRVDLSDVRYADSAGLGALIVMWKSIDKAAHNFKFTNLSEFALETIRNTNLDKIFKIEG